MKTVNIIGAGDYGLFCALFALRAGYKVKIFDKEGQDCGVINEGYRLSQVARKAASGLWTRVHAGFEYPSDEKTALALLESAIAFHRIIPESVFSKHVGAHYLISNKAEAEGKRTTEKQLKTAQSLKQRYATLPIGDQIYGNSEEFFTKITSSDLASLPVEVSNNFVGGVKSKEKCIIPEKLTQLIFDNLEKYSKQNQLEILPNHHIEKISRISDEKFSASLKDRHKIDLEGYVINCAGISAFSLASQLQEKEMKEQGIIGARIYKRGMFVTDISNLKEEEKTTIFPMGAVLPNNQQEEGICGMFCAIEEDSMTPGYVYVVGSDGCYLPIGSRNNIELTIDDPVISDDDWHNLFEDIEDKDKRISEAKKRLKKTYPSIATKLKIKDLNIQPLIIINSQFQQEQNQDSYSQLQERPPHIVYSKDFVTAFGEKGVHCVQHAREIITKLLTQDKREQDSLRIYQPLEDNFLMDLKKHIADTLQPNTPNSHHLITHIPPQLAKVRYLIGEMIKEKSFINDPAYINYSQNRILNELGEFKDLFTVFSVSDLDGEINIDGRFGEVNALMRHESKIPNLLNVGRDYVKRLVNAIKKNEYQEGNIEVGSAVIGSTSNVNMIPAGFSVNNKIITFGLSITSLAKICGNLQLSPASELASAFIESVFRTDQTDIVARI